jgi:hypothetical protein
MIFLLGIETGGRKPSKLHDVSDAEPLLYVFLVNGGSASVCSAVLKSIRFAVKAAANAFSFGRLGKCIALRAINANTRE